MKHPRGMDQEATGRFWSKVDRRGPQDCWIWYGTLGHKSVYPLFGLDGRNVSARRIMWRLCSTEPVPDGPLVPSCGDRQCVNPAHFGLPHANIEIEVGPVAPKPVRKRPSLFEMAARVNATLYPTRRGRYLVLMGGVDG